MAHSFVTFNDKHVRVNDFDLIAFAYFTMRAAANIKYPNEISEMFHAWIDSIANDGAGNIDLQLEKFLVNERLIGSFIDVLKCANLALSHEPDEFRPTDLDNLIGIKGIKFGMYKKTFLQNTISDLKGIITS